jgi:hypothetical protein
LSAQVYTSYSSWLEGEDQALRDKYAPGMYGGAEPQTKSQAFEGFYRARSAMDKYAVRKFEILSLGFPIALALAFLLARLVGWLEHVNLGQGVAGLMLVYLVPGPVIFLSGLSFYVLTIPCLAVAALVLALSLKLMTSRWSSKVLLGFSISGAISVAFWFLVGIGPAKNSMDMAWNAFFFSLNVMWAGIFGIGLAVSPAARAVGLVSEEVVVSAKGVNRGSTESAFDH